MGCLCSQPGFKYEPPRGSFIKTNFRRYPPSFTKDQSVLSASLRFILYDPKIGPEYRNFAARHLCDENILFIDLMLQYTSATAAIDIYQRFIKHGAPRQVNIAGGTHSHLTQLYKQGNFGEFLRVCDQLIPLLLEDIKKSDCFRQFVQQSPESQQLIASFHTSLLAEVFESGSDVVQLAPFASRPELVLLLRDLHQNKSSRHQLLERYRASLEMDPVSFLNRDTDALIREYTEILSRDSDFTHKIKEIHYI